MNTKNRGRDRDVPNYVYEDGITAGKPSNENVATRQNAHCYLGGGEEERRIGENTMQERVQGRG